MIFPSSQAWQTVSIAFHRHLPQFIDSAKLMFRYLIDEAIVKHVTYIDLPDTVTSYTADTCSGTSFDTVLVAFSCTSAEVSGQSLPGASNIVQLNAVHRHKAAALISDHLPTHPPTHPPTYPPAVHLNCCRSARVLQPLQAVDQLAPRKGG
jgi:hypothetical protein